MDVFPLIISLDYELFFGPKAGSVDRCLVRPTEHLVRIAKRFGLRYVVFVDALMIDAFERASRRWTCCRRDLDQIRRHLDALGNEGHDLELHVHPHWMTARFDGEGWAYRQESYRIDHFSTREQGEILDRALAALSAHARRPPRAFRAGGWCSQPFGELGKALLARGIDIDSSVIPGAYSADPSRPFDYRPAPRRLCWRFSDDPPTPDEAGEFTEVAVTPVVLRPWHYASMLAHRRLSDGHRAMGDGTSLSAGGSEYLRRLGSLGNVEAASIDGPRIGRCKGVLRRAAALGWLAHLMGHPKNATPASLDRLVELIQQHGSRHSLGIQEFVDSTAGANDMRSKGQTTGQR